MAVMVGSEEEEGSMEMEIEMEREGEEVCLWREVFALGAFRWGLGLKRWVWRKRVDKAVDGGP
jgi:hypothetical protein